MADLDKLAGTVLGRGECITISVTFTVANSIFTREGFAVEQAFIETNRQSFDATVEALDFSDPDGAAKTMNDWAKKHTNGRIDEIMEPSMITPDLVMTLMNALYFKADWRYAFEEKATKDEPFALRDGSTRNVKMMHQEGTFPHYAGDGFEALELPYGDSLYALTVLLPDAGRDDPATSIATPLMTSAPHTRPEATRSCKVTGSPAFCSPTAPPAAEQLSVAVRRNHLPYLPVCHQPSFLLHNGSLFEGK